MQITCSIKKCKIVINPSVTFGRVALAFRPAVESLTDSIKVFNPVVNSAVPPTMTEYDILDRTTKVTLPTGDSTRTAYGFGQHDGKTYFQPSTTDPLGSTVRTLTNTIGLTVKQSAPLGAVTTFTYDPIGQLLSSTDPGGLTTTHTYDMLGRRTQRTHPDAGTDRWTYDPAGNMLTHQTQLLYNANKSVNYHYTYSRLDSIVYPDNPKNNVRYTYGDSTAADNANGRVALLEDASGWQSFKYGKMGEVIENNRTFVLPKEDSAYSFKMTYEYDNWKIYANRMKRELFLTSAAQYYPSAPLRNRNSSLSIWLSVDPLVDKYPNQSPYTYCANNPVGLVDPDGEDIYKPGVRIYFFNGDIGIGISYALSANMVSGIARDKGGVTRFQANSFNYIVNQNLNENSSKPSCFIGFDLSITAHAIWDWSANSFDDFVGKQLNTINLGVGPSASLTGGDCFIGIGIGGGYGGGYDIETLNVKRSISLSYNEVKRIKKLSNIVGFPIWEVANQKKISNENGVPVGFSATIQTYDINNNPIPTGISIYCGVDDRGCPDNRWKSKEYDIGIR